MLINQTIDKLNYMKLFGLVYGLEEQRSNPEVSSLSFEDRVSLLVDREWTDRENRKLTRLLKEAKLKVNACLEDIDYRTSRGLDRSQVSSLATFDWARKFQHVVICGATGTGKTYLSCAFGNGACRSGLRTLYFRVPKILEELRLSKVDGSYVRLMAKLGRVQLLILDDWGLSPLTDGEARDILEVIEEIQGKGSLVIAGQLPLENWHQAISNPTVADAILDRVAHNSYKFNLKGESMRKTYAKTPANSATL